MKQYFLIGHVMTQNLWVCRMSMLAIEYRHRNGNINNRILMHISWMYFEMKWNRIIMEHTNEGTKSVLLFAYIPRRKHLSFIYRKHESYKNGSSGTQQYKLYRNNCSLNFSRKTPENRLFCETVDMEQKMSILLRHVWTFQ